MNGSFHMTAAMGIDAMLTEARTKHPAATQ